MEASLLRLSLGLPAQVPEA